MGLLIYNRMNNSWKEYCSQKVQKAGVEKDVNIQVCVADYKQVPTDVDEFLNYIVKLVVNKTAFEESRRKPETWLEDQNSSVILGWNDTVFPTVEEMYSHLKKNNVRKQDAFILYILTQFNKLRLIQNGSVKDLKKFAKIEEALWSESQSEFDNIN